jgi:SPP1 family predicted phage head-tail adaptor
MNAGMMDRRVTIQAGTLTTNDFREEVKGWADEATVWASKREETGTERIRAGRVEERQAVTWQIRYRRLPADRRLKDEDGIYEITGTREIGRRQFLEIQTVRVS